MSSRCAAIALHVVLLSCIACPAQSAAPARSQMIILGVDGMDPVLLRQFMSEGLTPNLTKLAERGGFVPLGTSIPPQSPVAWSNLITGMDSGQHGIFDFVHLDRKSLTPYLSTARVQSQAREPLKLGRWRIPLSAEKTLQLRAGPAFWDLLEQRDIPTTIFQIPANYPPVPAGVALSGMGTPDMKGTSGTFAYYTEDPAFAAGPVSGGVIHRVSSDGGVIHAAIEGPPNAFLDGTPYAKTEFTVRVDKKNPVALIEVGEHRVLLNEGEWSDWISVDFELLPHVVSVSGIVRFFLRSATQPFSLYATPVNIDPRRPAQPIAHPPEYSSELATAVGPFYTQEMPEETKALSARVLRPREFLAHSGFILEERRRLLEHELRRFREQQQGLLFFYFSSVDQRHHMLARQSDPTHPFHAADTTPDLATAMARTYREIDGLVGKVMREIDPHATLVVMSDHGFAPFRRQAHLNAWLEQHGYLALKDRAKRNESEWLAGIDWSKTRAFALGLNSLYLNVRGRERYGIVPVAERAALAREIAKGLHEWRDSANGESVVTQASLREDVYHGPYLREAPDIIVGYARGYRPSWATTSGKIPAALIEDNAEEWSGDHCIDSREVPGVLLVNRPLKARDPDLMDLTVAILTHFGVPRAAGMRGTPAF